MRTKIHFIHPGRFPSAPLTCGQCILEALRSFSTSFHGPIAHQGWANADATHLSFCWFGGSSQIPIMIQSKLFPIWNNAQRNSSRKTTSSRSNRNWYKIFHFYFVLYSLRFCLNFFCILFFENLNSWYSRGRFKCLIWVEVLTNYYG